MPSVTLMNDPLPAGDTGVIQAFFTAAFHLLFEHSPSHPSLNSQIRVRYGIEGPRVRYGGNSVAGYDIDLTAENNDWCKHVYQFAHESCHVLAQFQQRQHPNQWFEEALCEAASLYVLQRTYDLGVEDQGPCVNLFYGQPPRPFYQAIKDYVDELIAAPDRQFSGASLAHWRKQNENSLRADPYRRDLTNIVANKLFSLFSATPMNWAAVEFLNTRPCSTDEESFREYLDNWKLAAPIQHRTVINQVRGQLVCPIMSWWKTHFFHRRGSRG